MNIGITCERIYIWTWILRYIFYSQCFMMSRNLWYIIPLSIVLHFTLAMALPFNYNLCLPYATNKDDLNLTAQFMALYWMSYAFLWIWLCSRVLDDRFPLYVRVTRFFWKKTIRSRETAQMFIDCYHSNRRQEVFQVLNKHSNLPNNLNILIHNMVFLNTCDYLFTERLLIVKEIVYNVLNVALVLSVSLWMSFFGRMIDKYCLGKFLFVPVNNTEIMSLEYHLAHWNL